MKTKLRSILTRRSSKRKRGVLRRRPVRVAIVFVLPALILYITSPYWSELLKDKSLTLTDAEKSLVGNTTIDKKYIKETLDSITFNRAEEVEGVSEDVQKVLQLAAQKEESTGERPYKVTFSKADDQSITVSDDTDTRSIKLTPQFESFNVGLDADSRVVYSRGSQEKHVYTLKKNGIKNDIILREKPQQENIREYAWNVEIDNKLEMRKLPNGGIGIYSADPLLFGSIQTGDDDSAERLNKARENGKKDHLIFELPAPFITDERGMKNYEDVNYEIKDSIIILQVRNLQNLNYPLSIDPTVTVTTSSDFRQKYGDTGNIDFTTDGEIRRIAPQTGRPSSGTLDDTNTFYYIYEHATVAYNGYLYIIGGKDDFALYPHDTIEYCVLNTNGSVGQCNQQSSAFTAERSRHTSVVFNGYLYIIGGNDLTPSYFNDIQYCPINSNGSVGTCTQQTNAFTTARAGHTSVVYNGFLYIIGGVGNSGANNDIQYCPINSNGSVGTCTQQTNAFTTARTGHASVVYNGFLYIIGGVSGLGLNDIIYCALNSDGSVSTCFQQTNAFTTPRYDIGAAVYNGTLYIHGGWDGGSSYPNDTQYCPLFTTGNVGACSIKTNILADSRRSSTVTIYNGYMYIVGGFDDGIFTAYNDINYFSLNESLDKVGWTTDTGGNFSGIRYGHGAVIYGGYYYIFGGLQNGTHVNDIQSAPINVDGSLGAWDTNAMAGANANFTNIRRQFGYFVYNGYLYIGAGWNGTTNYSDVQYALICTGANNGVGGCGSNAGEIGTWGSTSSLNTTRRNTAAIAYNGYAYFVGGNNPGVLDSTEYAPINANGTIGTWTTDTGGNFSTGRYGMAIAAYNGYLYVTGGSDISVSLSDVQYAPLNSDGSVGAWAATTSFTTGREYHTLSIYNGKMYVVAGEILSSSTACKNSGSSTWCTDLQYATINSNGTVGSWTTSTSYMTNAKMGHTSGIVNGYLYVAGGVSNNVYYNDSLYIPVDIIHSGLSTNTQQTTAFTTARSGHSSVVYNSYIYIIGGTNGSYQNDIQSCLLFSDGLIDFCTQQTNAFTTARAGHTSVAYNGYLYIIGGYSGSYQNDIQRCPISVSDGTVGSCTQQTNIFTTARSEHASAVYDGYLYITGGTNGTRQNDVHYCALNTSTGAVTSCTQQTSAFTTARDSHGSVAYDGYLYIVGGYDGTNYLSDIQYCAISASNGSIGTCSTKGGALDFRRSSFAISAYDGYLYITGGATSGLINDIQYCPLRSNGIPDQCVYKPSAITGVREGATSVIWNGFLYIIGGYNGSSYQDDINYSSVKFTNYTSKYERVIDTGSTGNAIMSFMINGSSPCNYRVSYKMAGVSNSFGSLETVIFARPGSAQTVVGGGNMRYIHLSISGEDSYCGALSTITDIIVTYDQVPSVPTLVVPVTGATGVAVLPEFRIGSSDVSNDYLRYRIQVCSNNDCSSVVRTIDQTLSQTGWISQSQQSGTAYSGGEFITQLAIHQYQTPALSQSTQYWWRAQAIDPGGTNTWSAYSSIQSFTTGLTGPSQININGGTTINGGSTLRTGN